MASGTWQRHHAVADQPARRSLASGEHNCTTLRSHRRAAQHQRPAIPSRNGATLQRAACSCAIQNASDPHVRPHVYGACFSLIEHTFRHTISVYAFRAFILRMPLKRSKHSSLTVSARASTGGGSVIRDLEAVAGPRHQPDWSAMPTSGAAKATIRGIARIRAAKRRM